VGWLIQRDMTTLSVLRISALIYALFVPLAVWAGHFHAPRPMPPEPRWQLLRFDHIEGFAFRSRPLLFIHFEDDQADAQHLPLILYEDDKPIGPAHSVHYDIENVGRGRYSHWKEFGILMSTGDNTDPGKNGRLYWVGLPKQ
jgi:hypothetical protein